MEDSWFCVPGVVYLPHLPGIIALPAGWGDIEIGATAAHVAMRLANPDHRKSFIFWQVLEISDLVMAITLGTIASLVSPHGITAGAMTVIPVSLIPTFAVALLIILHVICYLLDDRTQLSRYVSDSAKPALISL